MDLMNSTSPAQTIKVPQSAPSVESSNQRLDAETESTFASPQALLAYLIGSADRLVLQVRRNGKKYVFPTPIDPGEIPALIEQHLAGAITERTCMRKDGSTFAVKDSYALGVYAVNRHIVGYRSSFLVLDIDGPDHVSGVTAEQVEALATALVAVLTEAGLNPILERSHGGQGRHVWVIFPKPVDAAFAQAIGLLARSLVPGGEKIEVFPKQTTLREDSYGSAIALPLCGKPPGVDGGTFWRAGQQHGVEAVRMADSDALAALHAVWRDTQRTNLEVAQHREAIGRFMRVRQARTSDPKDFSDLGLELVSQRLGEISDDRETEPHILRLICPHHGGTSLHVCPEQRWWKCHACDKSGAGPVAEFLLAVWLLPDTTEEQVLDRLRTIRGEIA